MRSGWGRWLLVGLAALLPTVLGLVVNLATNLPLPGFSRDPWVIWPTLAVLTVLSVLVALRQTEPAEPVLPVAGRVRLLTGSARLPADPTPLLGRDAELDELRDYLTAWDQTGPRVAVLTGPAGVGKSAVAVHLAHQLIGRLSHRPLYADLGGTGSGRRDPGEVLGWFLHVLGVADEAIPPGLEERASLYQSRLGDQRRLVVLDNAADAQQLHGLLPEGPGCWVLVTSRARLATLAQALLLELDVLPSRLRSGSWRRWRVANGSPPTARPRVWSSGRAAGCRWRCGLLRPSCAAARRGRSPTWPSTWPSDGAD